MAPAYPLIISDRITVGGIPIELASPPKGMRTDPELGLLLGSLHVSGKTIYESPAALGETRAIITPSGDYLLMFPTTITGSQSQDCGYSGKKAKVNDIVAFRSKDHGNTWEGPSLAFDIDYNQHGFIPLIPRGSSRIYAFGTQPVWGLYNPVRGQEENAPIGYRYSDDNGNHWSEVRLIRPANDPEFMGMSVTRMCETDNGTWLIGSHEADWSYNPLITRQYVLRSVDQGKTWSVSPNPRHGGWYVPAYNRMDEGRPICLGGNKVLMVFRTPEGHLWSARSQDDGCTWSDPTPTSLVHPDAPPMIFHLSDRKTLVVFHHNRASDRHYTGLDGSKVEVMKDRSEVWVSTSVDEGETWSEPRFLFANAAVPNMESLWRSYQCSYLDMILDGDMINLFVPHRWQRVCHMQFKESVIFSLPTAKDISS